MGMCIVQRFVDGKLESFTCDQVKEFQLEWKKQFREENGTDRTLEKGMNDRAYDEFCDEIDTFINKTCTCDKIALTCEKCSPEQHEGHFCRCEDRNIRLARQLRNEGHSHWRKTN